MQTSKDFTPMLVLVPNGEVEFFAQFCQKIGYKTEQTQDFENFKNEILNDIFENPKNRAVFERLKDK
ncbi:MAG: hypothetical protein J6M14_01185 [Campylobacter sp.]|nr:hypothetical protein [Campylobacter sp.]